MGGEWWEGGVGDASNTFFRPLAGLLSFATLMSFLFTLIAHQDCIQMRESNDKSFSESRARIELTHEIKHGNGSQAKAGGQWEVRAAFNAFCTYPPFSKIIFTSALTNAATTNR